MLEDKIVSLLAKSPADQYSLYRQIGDTSMSKLLKAICALQQRKIIRVAKYRKSYRTGLEIPIYSLSESCTANNNNNSSSNSGFKRLDIHNLLVGITSERLVEYEFVARNLVSSKKQAAILDIGSGSSLLAKAIGELGKGKWQVFRIDIAESNCDARMDARMTGFRKEVFSQVICISTIEHIGIGINSGDDDEDGDLKTVKEILRILKKGGSAIISVPYGKIKKLNYRVYDRHALSRLVAVDNEEFSVAAKKEFYCYDAGKWKRCSQSTADRNIADDVHAPLHFHSVTCACILLRKR
ncbi:MAG: methyltransferase domain-containing protein [Nitrososphaeraceae archaeon]|nr:methyltransferase domain-containing protein [Nitrososphaeraceae archaeon]